MSRGVTVAGVNVTGVTVIEPYLPLHAKVCIPMFSHLEGKNILQFFYENMHFLDGCSNDKC